MRLAKYTFCFSSGISEHLQSVQEGAEGGDGGVELGLQGGALGQEGGDQGGGGLQETA